MLILADENVERRGVLFLRDNGYSVDYVAEQSSGIDDTTVLDRAVKAYDLLLTGDKDFGELHFHQGFAHKGVLLYRLDRMPTMDKARLILKTLQENEAELQVAFTVVTPIKIRIRKL
ncbi:hypothetical protein BN8_03744 [Fibrisoma limi BUZ 3]|uniref:DUF5615 domain-containing protein n=1 Tax=Fibrisoma limi BUZ 3 TaxID=1185876 RepID=I2GKY6_9BACT|nr:DUF5615 family PIN-like protein [Fibrisoma limi]CCH54562.1 hypothetical protein BN8_03744 [Fibrisoma limi BUZ 3]